MRIKLSDQTIDALALIISGGSQNDPAPSIGLYRAGWQLVEFFKAFRVEVDLASQSRVPATKQSLLYMVFIDNEAELKRLIERAADPRDFINEPARHTAVVEYLNRFLAYDNLKLEMVGHAIRLFEIVTTAGVVSTIGAVAEALDFDTVSRDLDRALRSAADDPEDAVTAACSVVESVCWLILIETGMELPVKQDIGGYIGPYGTRSACRRRRRACLT